MSDSPGREWRSYIDDMIAFAEKVHRGAKTEFAERLFARPIVANGCGCTWWMATASSCALAP